MVIYAVAAYNRVFARSPGSDENFHFQHIFLLHSKMSRKLISLVELDVVPTLTDLSFNFHDAKV